MIADISSRNVNLLFIATLFFAMISIGSLAGYEDISIKELQEYYLEKESEPDWSASELLFNGKYEEARKEYKKLLETSLSRKDHKYVEKAYEGIASSFLWESRFSEGRDYLKKLIDYRENHPFDDYANDPNNLLDLATAHFVLGEFYAAHKIFSKFRESHTSEIAMALIERGRSDDAIATLKKAIDEYSKLKKPSDKDFYSYVHNLSLLAYACSRKGDNTVAMEHIDKAFRECENSAIGEYCIRNARLYKALILDVQGEYQASNATMQKCLGGSMGPYVDLSISSDISYENRGQYEKVLNNQILQGLRLVAIGEFYLSRLIKERINKIGLKSKLIAELYLVLVHSKIQSSSAEITQATINKCLPLFEQLYEDNDKEYMEFKLLQKRVLSILDKDAKRLFAAVESNSMDDLKRLLSEGLDVNTMINGGTSLLHLAVNAGNVKMADYLIKQGANVNAQDFLGFTPLSRAVLSCPDKQKMAMVVLLIENKADPNICGLGGHPPIHWSLASAQATGKILQYLLAHGADVNKQDDNGGTILHMAADSNMAIAVVICLKAGADITLKNKEGKTAAMIAEERGNQDIVDIIEKYADEKDEKDIQSNISFGTK